MSIAMPGCFSQSACRDLHTKHRSAGPRSFIGLQKNVSKKKGQRSAYFQCFKSAGLPPLLMGHERFTNPQEKHIDVCEPLPYTLLPKIVGRSRTDVLLSEKAASVLPATLGCPRRRPRRGLRAARPAACPAALVGYTRKKWLRVLRV